LLLILLALGSFGLLEAFGCDCHDDDLRAESAVCDCACACCVSGLVAPVAESGAHASPVPPLIAFRPSPEDLDTGRLSASFIFTPPRA
jgi:hypothetical protein